MFPHVNICFYLASGEKIPRSSILKFIGFDIESSEPYQLEVINPFGREIILSDNRAYTDTDSPSQSWINTGMSANNFSPLRNNVLFTMTCKDTAQDQETPVQHSITGAIRQNDGTGINSHWNLFDARSVVSRYFLQPQNEHYSGSSNREFLNFSIEGARLWYKEIPGDQNQNTILNSRLPLGNCALFNSSEIIDVQKGSSVY